MRTKSELKSQEQEKGGRKESSSVWPWRVTVGVFHSYLIF